MTMTPVPEAEEEDASDIVSESQEEIGSAYTYEELSEMPAEELLDIDLAEQTKEIYDKIVE